MAKNKIERIDQEIAKTHVHTHSERRLGPRLQTSQRLT